MEPIPATELPAGLAWLNAAPTTLRRQRGRVVALAFVNVGSAWCGQRLQELAQLQQRAGGRLVVWAIHVPRFDCERDPAFVRSRYRRHGVAFPLLHDPAWKAWQDYQIDSWPTVALIDAEGQLRGRVAGLTADLDKRLMALCEHVLLPPDLDPRPLPEVDAEPRLPLAFPTGLAANAERLYVADTGHHRVLECTHAGRVLRQFGSGAGDLMDGEAEHAAFRRPHGLALMREFLYVADTGNHALRRINLRSGQVDTLVGNGREGLPIEGPVTDPRAISLSQPLGIVATDTALHLAMAGDNRLWSYDPGRHELKCQAGSGQLDVRDGSGMMAAFAQPASVAVVQQTLYVADASGSAIRSMQLRNGVVQTLVGRDAWTFGDTDGPREQASLQSPQALALSPDAPLLWIADTGNGCLRTLRLGGGMLATVSMARRLKGPAGLALAAGKVWVAETDAHAVVCFDPATGELSHVAIDE
ncbi:MAG: hypothetical protein ABW178_03680 [Pseudoxanthomonas sp.]